MSRTKPAVTVEYFEFTISKVTYRTCKVSYFVTESTYND